MKSGSKVAFVAIGRNEGERLKRCLNAIIQYHPDCKVVYVDSGSNDGSVEFARSLCCEIVELDMSTPFTAARARNAGANLLLNSVPDLEYFQFLDGDCELEEHWVSGALDFFSKNPDVGICSGRRMERFPDNSLYNKLIDIEWNTPVGKTKAVLGDMLVKVEAFQKVSGFDEAIISAEDDDFCLRVASEGYAIHRIDLKMSTHDADMMLLSQWYKRAMRGGHGYANINRIHGHRPEKYFWKHLSSAVIWGGVVPLLFVILLIVNPILSLGLLAFYASMIVRLGVKMSLNSYPARVAFPYAFLIYTGKVSECLGAIRYWKNSLFSKAHYLIEYK